MVNSCHRMLHGTIPIQSWRSDCIKDDNQVGAQITICFFDDICRNLYTKHTLSTEPSYQIRWQVVVEVPVCSAGPLPCNCYLCKAFINTSLLKSQSHIPCVVLHSMLSLTFFLSILARFCSHLYHYIQKSVISSFGLCRPDKRIQTKSNSRLQVCQTRPSAIVFFFSSTKTYQQNIFEFFQCTL